MGIFLDINRRHLLTSAAIVSVAPNIPRASFLARTGITNSDTHASPYPEVAAPDFSKITILRIREIAQRNSIREQAGLPLLSVPKELRRMKEAADAEKFRAFVEANRKRVYAKMLRRIRGRCGEPNWAPSGVLSGGGMWFSAEVDRQIGTLYRRITRTRVAGRVNCPVDLDGTR
jgi:hypothetical protein